MSGYLYIRETIQVILICTTRLQENPSLNDNLINKGREHARGFGGLEGPAFRPLADTSGKTSLKIY